jgi:serine/threonine protein kinase
MQSSTVYCDNCGAANWPTARFCTKCGHAMPAATSLPPTVPAGVAPSPPTPPSVQASRPPSAPTGRLAAHSLLIGRYLILRQLGQGGMGAVYQAADTRLEDRLVAVKEMSQKGLDPQEIVEAADGFRHEAVMLASLPHHSHLPSIYDHFEDGGRWYLVMDFIEGETLEEYLAKAGGKLPVAEVLEIGIQLCTVLSYLHTHKPPIIFRDLKPANIMRTPEGDLFLIDFGIARHFKPGQAKDTVAYGSAGYAAPEQYGKAQTTPQSDIYSLGATLHHLLSGDDPSQMPFQFAPLSDPTLPAGLGTLIARMLAMNSNQRPASMAEVKQELQRIAAQSVASKLPPTQPPTISVQPGPSKKPSRASPPSPPKPVKASPSLGTVLYTYRGHSDAVLAVAWSPDGKRIASTSGREVRVWDAANGSHVLTYRGHTTGTVCALAWSPDGQYIASGNSNNLVRVCYSTTAGHVFTYQWHSGGVGTVAWSPDSQRIASGSGDKTVQVWDAIDGGHDFTYRRHSSYVSAVAWSPDGKRIASGSGDKTVQVWDAIGGGYDFTYRGHSDGANAVAWSPDGRRIASGSSDSTVQVWDAVDGGHVFTYKGHSDYVTEVAWSLDGTRIASGGYDKTVQVWDAATGGNVYTYRGHSAEVRAVAWSPDGRRIASASDDKTVQVWQAV